MKHCYILLPLLFLLICFESANCQNIWYVSVNAAGNGSSWAQASGNLQLIIDNAAPGDAVWVKQGSYQQTAGESFHLRDGVAVLGGFPSVENPGMTDRNPKQFETILSGNQSRVLQASGVLESLSPSTILDGFTLRNGYASVGAGIWIYNCDATFRNLNIENNTSFQGLGGGLSISNSNSTFIQVLIHHNTTELTPGSDGEAAAMRINGGNLKFYNCVIANNHAQGYIGGIWLTNTTTYFYNCIVYGNTADNQFSTFTNDNYNSGTGANFYASNCILQGCGSSDYFFEGPQYMVYGNDLGGNRDVNPMFNEDYSLQQGSYGINHGNTNAFQLAVNTVATDFYNNPRIVDAIDIGLNESQDVQAEVLYVKQGGTGNGSSWAQASGDLQLMMDNQLRQREVWVAEGTYFAPAPYFRLRDSVKVYGGFPSSGNPGFDERDPQLHPSVLTSVNQAVVGNFFAVYANISPATILDGFVITSNENSPEYMYGLFESNSDATYANIVFTGLHYSAVENRRASHNTFTNCDFVDNIATDTPGVNYPVTVQLIDRAQSTFSGCRFAGNYSFQGSAISVVDDSNAIINDCVFENNNNNAISGLGKVIVVLDSKATITNSIFDSNGDSSFDGGIVGIFGTNTYPDAPWMVHPLRVTIDRCVFRNNLNSSIWYQGKPEDFLAVNNSLFFKNTAANGGAIRRHFGGDLYVTNCTITQNTATNQLAGGIYMSDSTAEFGLGISEIRNCIIYNNTALFTYGPNLWTYRPVTIKNSLIPSSGGSSNWDGGAFNDFNLPDYAIDSGGNIDVAPLFVDAENEVFRLTQESPAVNAGSNSVFSAGSLPDLSGLTLDLGGNPRIFAQVVDMGAYEFDPELGGDALVKDKTISIYPNPVGDILHVAADDLVNEITVFDLLGKKMLSSVTNYVDVSGLSRGVYVVQVRLLNGGKFAGKVVKD